MSHPSQDALVDVALALGPEARARIAHVHDCPECRAQIDEVASIEAALTEAVQPDPAVLTRISGALRAAGAREHPQRARRWRLAAQGANGLLASSTVLVLTVSAGIDVGTNVGAAAATAVLAGFAVALLGGRAHAWRRHPSH